MMTLVAGGSSPLALFFPFVLQVMYCISIKEYSSNQTKSCQEQLEHAEVSTALRYLGQYYFKNKLYDEASLCAQRCCDYNDVSVPVRFEKSCFSCCCVVGTDRSCLALQAREEGKALLRQISQVRDQIETPSADLFAPLSNNNTPVRRVSPLNLISFTP